MKPLAVMACLFLWQSTLAAEDCASRLYGTWQSDADHSMAYIDEHVKLRDNQHAFLHNYLAALGSR